MKILFTRATGFLGVAGVPALLSESHDTTGLARDDRMPPGSTRSDADPEESAYSTGTR